MILLPTALFLSLVIVNEILTTHSMEEIDFSEDMISDYDISQFIKKLPEIGSHLKNLNLENTLLEEYGDLENIKVWRN